MTREEYLARKAATRARPDWKPAGEPRCGDCETMSHCEVHHKVEGYYPGEDVVPADLDAVLGSPSGSDE